MLHNSYSEKVWFVIFGEKLGDKRPTAVLNHRLQSLDLVQLVRRIVSFECYRLQ